MELNFGFGGLISANSTISIEIAGNGGAGQPTGHDKIITDLNDFTLTDMGTLTVIETGVVPVGDYTIYDGVAGSQLYGVFSTVNLPPNYIVLYYTDSIVVRKLCPPSVSIAANPGNTVCVGTNVMFDSNPY